MTKRTLDPEFNKNLTATLKPSTLTAQFHQIAHDTVEGGVQSPNRTATDSRSTFSQYMKVSCAGGAVASVQSRFVPKKTFLRELLWFISGSTDIGKLIEQDVHLWDAWVRKESAIYDKDGKLVGGDIGPGAYGKQWRFWEDTRIIDQADLAKFKDRGYTFVTHVEGVGKSVVTRNIDQLKSVENTLRTNPKDRRMVVTPWNPGFFEDMALLPCHSFFVFKTIPKAKLTERALPRQMANWLEYALHNRLDAKLNELVMDTFPVIPEYLFQFAMDKRLEVYQNCVEDAVAKRCPKLQALYELMPEYTLNLHLTCRSQDFLVGTVANVFQYSLMLQMMAKITGMVPGEFSWVGVDTHVYIDQLDAYMEQAESFQEQKGKYEAFKPCWVRIHGDQQTMDDFKFEDFEFYDDALAPKLKFPIAV